MIDQALTYCLQLMRAGWEWPDASAKAATRYGVRIEALTEAYDNQHSTRGQLLACL